MATFSLAYSATSSQFQTIQIGADGGNTFAVTNVPGNYTGYLYYRTSPTGSLIDGQSSDTITPFFESDADFNVDTTGIPRRVLNS